MTANDNTPTSDKLLDAAVARVARDLEARGTLREPAREMAERHRERLYVTQNGDIRVTSAEGGFYPADSANPTAQLVDELFGVAPAAVKRGGSGEDVFDRAAQRFADQRARQGVNPLLRNPTT